MSTNTKAISDDIRKKAEAVTAVDQLRAFVERIERVEEEIKTLNDDKSDIYKEAAAIGFDKKALKKVVSRRKVDADQRQEEDALFGMYWDAIHGVGHVHARARENIEEFDAETGEILNDRRSYAGLNILTKHTEITASDGASPAVRQLAGSARDEESAVSNSPETATECAAPERDAAAGDGAISAVNARAGLENAVGVEPSSSAPTQKSKLRPYCRNPGEACGGYGSKHCHACLIALEEEEAA